MGMENAPSDGGWAEERIRLSGKEDVDWISLIVGKVEEM